MRTLALFPLLMAAACSDGGEPKQAAAPADTTMAAGQWETRTEVTRLTSLDKGAPAIATPEGSKTSFTSCIAESDRKRPPPALFAGDAADCSYKDFYMSRGRMNASMTCRMPGVGGEVLISLEGKNDAASFEGTMSTSTQLPGSGDVRIASTISGRKVGACPAAD